jgi:hypothetical protein
VNKNDRGTLRYWDLLGLDLVILKKRLDLVALIVSMRPKDQKDTIQIRLI